LRSVRAICPTVDPVRPTSRVHRGRSQRAYSADIDPANRHDFEQAIGIVIDRTGQLSSSCFDSPTCFRLPPPLPRPCDLVAVLENVVRLLSARTDGAGITWRWELDDPSVLVAIDRGQMEQALLNVLTNAMEAIEGDGTITVRLTSRSAGFHYALERTVQGTTRFTIVMSAQGTSALAPSTH
jgi:nitrogen fixation/metabolism regulation signal transduction histidine kinase